MPRELRPINPRPLTESEEHTLRSLLDRSGQSLAAAEAQRTKERELEAKLRARQDKLAAEEARLSKRLAELRVDIDVVTAEIYKIAPSGVAFRHVADRLQEFGAVVPKQSYFNSAQDNMTRDQLMLLGEIALNMYEQAARPKGSRPLRERMKGIGVEIGPDGPDGPGDATDPRAAMARAIILAGKKARGEPL
jgi:hypothetical protein